MVWKIHVYKVQRAGRYNHILNNIIYEISPDITMESFLQLVGKDGKNTTFFRFNY